MPCVGQAQALARLPSLARCATPAPRLPSCPAPASHARAQATRGQGKAHGMSSGHELGTPHHLPMTMPAARPLLALPCAPAGGRLGRRRAACAPRNTPRRPPAMPQSGRIGHGPEGVGTVRHGLIGGTRRRPPFILVGNFLKAGTSKLQLFAFSGRFQADPDNSDSSDKSRTMSEMSGRKRRFPASGRFAVN